MTATSAPDPPVAFEGSQVVTRTQPVSDSRSPQGCGGQPEACLREGGAGWSWSGRTAHLGPPSNPPPESTSWTLDPPAWGWTVLRGEGGGALPCEPAARWAPGAHACFSCPPATEVSLEAPRVQGRRLGLPDEFLALREDTSMRTHWFNQHWALARWNSRLWPEP